MHGMKPNSNVCLNQALRSALKTEMEALQPRPEQELSPTLGPL